MKNKKYQLKSFVKINRLSTLEVLEELKKTGELPFEYTGDNWIYDYETEFQKRFGIIDFQYHTQDKMADNFIQSIDHLFDWQDDNILDACCGLGQLSNALLRRAKELNTNINSLECFDISDDLIGLAKYQKLDVKKYNFLYEFAEEPMRQEDELNKQYYNLIISNPPYGNVPKYEVNNLRGEIACYFMEWAYCHLADNGIIACILPCNFWKKNTKQFLELHNKFHLISEYDNKENFFNTKIITKFFVFEKLK